jgi:predicted NACHT family NTPase
MGNFTDLSDAEGIIVFRMEAEKGAKENDVFITGFLLNMVKNEIREQGIGFELLIEKVLKGFEGKTAIYKLIFPETEEQKETDILTAKMRELERDTWQIPVFGDLYPTMSMADNFVNLDIAPGEDIGAIERKKQTERMERLDSIALKEVETGIHHLNVEELYLNFNQGIIFGLPGSGKTTILKYFAFREFKKNQTIEDKDKQRVVMFIPCASIMDYDTWFTGTAVKPAIK